MSTSIAELREMSKLPAREMGGGNVAQYFEANKQSMAAVLPAHVKPERMLKIALTAIRSTPKLMKCTTASLMGAVMQCSSFGLEPNTVMGHAYLVPFWNSRQNRMDVQVIIGYRGLIDLARRSGQIVSIAAHAVYSNDEFSFEYGLEEKLSHKPAMHNRGEIEAFYAVAHLKDGGYSYEVMSREAVEAIRDNAQGYKQALRYAKRNKDGVITEMNTPWFTHFEEMGRKTAIRRLSKYLPISIEFAVASTLDAQAARGQEQHLEDVLTGEYHVVDEDAPEGATENMEESNQDAGADTPDRQSQVSQESQGSQVSQESQVSHPQEFPTYTPQGQWLDSNGEVFNAKEHVWDKVAGKPVVNKKGDFRRRPRPHQQQQPPQETSGPPPMEDGDPGFSMD